MSYRIAKELLKLARALLAAEEWYHGTPREYEKFERNQGPANEGALGLWVTSNPDLAGKLYGDKVWKVKKTLSRPYIMPSQNFGKAFFFPEVGVKHLTNSEIKTLYEDVDKIRKRYEELKNDDQLGRLMGNEHKEYAKLGKFLTKHDEATRKLFSSRKYFEDVREYLLSKGYDSIIFEHSTIDLNKKLDGALKHHVAVILRPESAEFERIK